MSYSKITNKLAESWGITYDEAIDVLAALDADNWAGGEISDQIKYAGVIDDDGTADKRHGHTGYWIADDDEHVDVVTNGPAAWAEWSEDVADDIGLGWGEYYEIMAGHEVGQ